MTQRTKCPTCSRLFETKQAFPFCSERCKLIDLGRWLGGDYRVEGEAISEDDAEEIIALA